jgi:hypothetical protein
MTTINWKLLKEYTIDQSRAIMVPWILVLDAPRESTHLQIKAEGKWTPVGGLLGDCDPDGLLGPPFQTDRLVVPDCPVGALIGKFGGSSASLSPLASPPTAPVAAATPASPPAAPPALTEGKAFAIGSYCVLAIPERSIGPLYVSFNGLIRPVNLVQLKINGYCPGWLDSSRKA